jgi:hypothetical protein
MKLYFASPANSDFYLLRNFGVENMLFSYHYLAKMQKKDYKKYLKCEDVFLDSGAFSAKNLGVEINLDEYIEFINDNQCEIYAGLDVIGDGVKTLENTNIMMKQGLKPIHTFHKGEEVEWLYKSLELDLDYIAIGGMVGISTKKAEMFGWLDKVWKIIMERRPDIKVHGFACTSYDFMTKYPWYSVDSTTWNVARKFGEGFDIRGKRKSKHKIMEDFKDISYFKRMAEGTKLVINTTHTMLEWEEQINNRHDRTDFNYLTNQQQLF